MDPARRARTRFLQLLAATLLAASLHADAANMREHTRPTDARDTSVTHDTSVTGDTSVSEVQAGDLALTTTPAGEQTIQTSVRTSATLDLKNQTLSAELNLREGALVQAGQRARAFQMSSRASMYQARVTHVTTKADRVLVEASLTQRGFDDAAPYILEITVDRGRFLAVPNAAIIEEGDRHIVYVQHHPGHYMPMEIHTGMQGELYTQVLHGLEGGEEVVTFGSFFVDAETKLKSSGGDNAAMGHEHHHH